MKKNGITSLLLVIGSVAWGQNTFPSTGNAGIGNTNPSFHLTIGTNLNNSYQSSPDLASIGIMSHGVGTAQGNLYLHRDDVTISQSNVLGSVLFTGADGGEQVGAEIRGVSAGSWSSGHSSSDLVFLTSTSGSSTPTEKARLTDNGNFGIGTTSPSSPLHIKSNTNRTIKLDFTGIGNGASYTWQSLTTNSVEQWRIVGRDDDNANLEFWNKTADKVLTFLQNGNVGMGTSNPDAKLHIENPTGINGTWLKFSEGVVDYRISNEGGRLKVQEGTNDRFVIRSGGNIGIGVASPDSKLVVDGKIRTEEVKVEIVNGPDYVFEEDYELRTLQETKEYIESNKHLPEIPSASEMETNGVDLGDMNMRLLKKIEELTLYQIELLEKVEELQNRVEKLENE